MSVITKVTTYDFRFPTSATFSGSDAMNPDPDYSSAYVVIATDAGDSGNGFVFTIGRGNDVVVRAIDSMSETLIGRNVEELLDNMRLAWDLFVRDSQLRWLGPEKGVEHMAITPCFRPCGTSRPSAPASRSGCSFPRWILKSSSRRLTSVT